MTTRQLAPRTLPRGARVLLLDDDDLLRRSLSRMLRRYGHSVTDLGSPIAVLKLLTEEDFDVIISDVLMPEMSGLDLLAELKRRHSGVPVILLSGYSPITHGEEAAALGAFSYLKKPIAPELLHAQVEEAAARRAVGRAHRGPRCLRRGSVAPEDDAPRRPSNALPGSP